jgi:hypothetical protein
MPCFLELALALVVGLERHRGDAAGDVADAHRVDGAGEAAARGGRSDDEVGRDHAGAQLLVRPHSSICTMSRVVSAVSEATHQSPGRSKRTPGHHAG